MPTPLTQASLDTYSIRRFFAGKGILITGSTGFLAKALVEKILRVLPEAGTIFLLIRPRIKADRSQNFIHIARLIGRLHQPLLPKFPCIHRSLKSDGH